METPAPLKEILNTLYLKTVDGVEQLCYTGSLVAKLVMSDDVIRHAEIVPIQDHCVLYEDKRHGFVESIWFIHRVAAITRIGYEDIKESLVMKMTELQINR